MNWSQMQADWIDLKEMLRTYWSVLTEEDLNTIDGNREKLARLLQHHLALGPDQIEKEIVAFETEVRYPGAVK